MKKTLAIFLLFSFYCWQCFADAFEYEDDNTKTTITGVLTDSLSRTVLTIPGTVVDVADGAFQNSSVTALIIDDANVHFSLNAFKDMKGSFTMVNMGSQMSETNMKSLILAMKASAQVEEGLVIEIEGLDQVPGGDIQWVMPDVDDPDDEDLSDEVKEMIALCRFLTEYVQVTLPAAKVASQVLGSAKVYGRFTLAGELSTFCGSQTFQDTDDGSNMLFYVPTNLESVEGDKQVYMKRVHYVKAGEGVLIHNAHHTATTAAIPRYTGTLTTEDTETYNNTMMKGVTIPTRIEKTDGDKTNFILYKGVFHPTSGGTLGANRAYLQVANADVESLVEGKLTMLFEEETDDEKPIDGEGEEEKDNESVTAVNGVSVDGGIRQHIASPMFNVTGQRVGKGYRGIVIRNGRKYVNQ